MKPAAFPRIWTMKLPCGMARWNEVFVCAARLIAIAIFVHAWYESHQEAWLFGAGSCSYCFIERLAKALFKLRRQ
jgi:L-asparagine transporter-like permease